MIKRIILPTAAALKEACFACGIPQPDMTLTVVGACAAASGIYTFDTCTLIGGGTICHWQWINGPKSVGLDVEVATGKSRATYSDFGIAVGSDDFSNDIECIMGINTGQYSVVGNPCSFCSGCIGSLFTFDFG